MLSGDAWLLPVIRRGVFPRACPWGWLIKPEHCFFPFAPSPCFFLPLVCLVLISPFIRCRVISCHIVRSHWITPCSRSSTVAEVCTHQQKCSLAFLYLLCPIRCLSLVRFGCLLLSKKKSNNSVMPQIDLTHCSGHQSSTVFFVLVNNHRTHCVIEALFGIFLETNKHQNVTRLRLSVDNFY